MKYINDISPLNRKVGPEASKTYFKKLNDGFFDKYCSGIGLDIGPTGKGTVDVVSILPTAIALDLDYPGYNGTDLPFPNASQDYIFSSHCLEHITDYKTTLKEWMRALKVGGHLVISVPHRDLYEKKLTLPSRFNDDHKRFYTASSLCKEIEESLPINSFRIRHLLENDEGHWYEDDEFTHGRHCYEIEIVVEKLK